MEEVGLEPLDPLEEVGLSIVQLVDPDIDLAFGIEDGVELGWPGGHRKRCRCPDGLWASETGGGRRRILEEGTNRLQQGLELELGADEIVGGSGQLGPEGFVGDQAGGIGAQDIGRGGDEVLAGEQGPVVSLRVRSRPGNR